ncbi:MAG: radical SAM protein [Armatimonadota bacterium]|nr:radical SAM protein [Armatimonadota bacterium]MDR5703653.1 radical SAM protein [Armatimonadota bacterium]MDR7434629.1 radical SAM protein [Armatimonadota bacterium]
MASEVTFPFLSIREGTINIGTRDGALYTFDREGRLFAAYRDGHLYRRGLDNRLKEKWSEGGRRFYRDVEGEEKAIFLEGVIKVVQEVVWALKRGDAEVLAPARAVSPREVEEVLERILRHDAKTLEEEKQDFFAVYKPVSILPPDQYLAVVFQATEGCHWNRCTFCTFYRDRPFRIKPLEEFRRHVRAVLEFLGEGLSMRRSIFLADANALVTPQPHLRAFIQTIEEVLPVREMGIYSFLDIFTGRRKPPEEFAELRELGLRRVYIGLETGDDELLRFLNKPGSARDAIEVVRALKGAGVHVGVIVMVGVGGEKFAQSHVDRTVEVLHAMELGPGDIIYLSEFIEFPGSAYVERARAEGIRPLDEGAIKAQRRTLIERLRFPSGRPKIARYSLQEYIY